MLRLLMFRKLEIEVVQDRCYRAVYLHQNNLSPHAIGRKPRATVIHMHGTEVGQLGKVFIYSQDTRSRTLNAWLRAEHNCSRCAKE